MTFAGVAPRVEREHVPDVVEVRGDLFDRRHTAPAHHSLSHRRPVDPVARIATLAIEKTVLRRIDLELLDRQSHRRSGP